MPGERSLENPEYAKIYYQEKLLLDVTELVRGILREKGLTQADLARKYGVTEGRISQLLNGEQNMNLRTVSDLLYCLGCRLAVSEKAIPEPAGDVSPPAPIAAAIK